MPAPSQLSIATSAVTRLLKEETTYRRELEGQEKRLRHMQEAEDDDENRDFNLKQEMTSIEETKAVFKPLHDRLIASTDKLESVLADANDDADSKEVEAAREAVKRAKESG